MSLALWLALAVAPPTETTVVDDGAGAASTAIEPRAFVRNSARCSKKVEHCFGLFAHVVYRDDTPVVTPAWLADRVRQANRLFSVIDVNFFVAKAEAIEDTWWHVATRAQRDEIGASRFASGQIHLFLVGQLDDVDVPDSQIRGVHWRLRRETTRRWVIMSQISGEMVLAHELGHFFSLPHSGYGVSVMNKRPRESPPWNERRFADPEVDLIRAARDEMVASGFLERR